MKLLVFVTLLAAASAAELFGKEKCTRGPGYWCQHISTAKECGAIQHCKDNVWSPKYTKQNDEVCDFCKEVITTARNLIANKATQKQVVDFLDSACDLIPDAELKSMCRSAVDEYADVLFDLIVSEMDPETICTAMGLCKPGVAIKPMIKKPNDDICTECKKFIGEAQQALKDNKTQEEVMEILDEFCQALGPLETQCQDYVNEYIRQIMNLIATELDPETICFGLGFCQGRLAGKLTVPIVDIKPAKKVAQKSSIECAVCTLAMQEIDSLITQNSTISEIISVVDKVCTILPDTIRGECKTFIDDYGVQIINLLVLKLSPNEICTKLGLCTANQKSFRDLKDTECSLCELVVQYLDSFIDKNQTKQKIVQGLHEFCNILPDSLKGQCNDIITQYGMAIPELLEQLLDPLKVCELIGLCTSNQVHNVGVKDDTTCQLCKFVGQYLLTVLEKNATQQEIEQALDQVCAILPASIKDECTSLVAEYGPIVFQLLDQLSPDQICQVLGLCSSSSVKVSPVKDDQYCDVCKLVAQYALTALKSNSTEAEIENALEQLCSALPASISDECTTLVKQYFPLIIQLLDTMTPDDVCKALGLCSSTKSPLVLKKTPLKNPTTCAVCELAMNYIDGFIDQNSTASEIIAVLDKVCSALPSSLGTECTALIDEYGPEILKLLVQQLDPKQVCSELGLCTAQKVKVAVKDSTTCEVCKLVGQYLLTVLKNNATEQEIEQALEEVCNLLPASVKDECNSLVQQYGPVLFSLLKSLSPSELCDAIGLCPGKLVVGADKCMFGPAFWCASETNAKLCNAVQHCKLHVW
ncbi:prosaposin-like isoform X1 [Glandiceps talaboti]